MPQALAHLSPDKNNAGLEQAGSPKEQLTQTCDAPYQDAGLLVV